METGSVYCQPTGPWVKWGDGTGYQSSSRRNEKKGVKFDRPFATTPHVFHSVVEIIASTSNPKDNNFGSWSDHATTTGFNISCTAYKGSDILYFRVDWIAIDFD